MSQSLWFGAVQFASSADGAPVTITQFVTYLFDLGQDELGKDRTRVGLLGGPQGAPYSEIVLYEKASNVRSALWNGGNNPFSPRNFLTPEGDPVIVNGFASGALLLDVDPATLPPSIVGIPCTRIVWAGGSELVVRGDQIATLAALQTT